MIHAQAAHDAKKPIGVKIAIATMTPTAPSHGDTSAATMPAPLRVAQTNTADLVPKGNGDGMSTVLFVVSPCSERD